MAAPPLPPRQPMKSTELDRHAMESASGGVRPSKYENSLIRNEVVNMYKSFVSEVDPKDVLDLLIQKRVISIERKDEVMSKVTKQDRCRALLDQLFSGSNDEAFLVLRQALYEHYHWIAERIDESKSANNEAISSGNLELSKSNEVKMTRQLDEASRKITELEEEVEKYRRRTLVLECELTFMKVSRDEALKRELKLKEQLARFKDWMIPTESEDEDDDALNPEIETQRGEGPAKRLTPPPLPRRPTGQDLVELKKNFMEPADNVQDTIISRPQLLTVVKGSTPVRGMALLDGWLYVVRFGSNEVEVYEARNDFRRSKKGITITIKTLGQPEKSSLFYRLKSRPRKEHVSSGIQDIASCNRNKRLYLSDWQNTCVHCVNPVKKEVIQSWVVESEKPWGISVTSEGNIIVSLADSGQLCEYSAKGLLLKIINLNMVYEGPWHGLQLGADMWVVCHGDRYHGDGCVCVVNSEGDYATGYKEIKLEGPSHLAILSSSHLFVAEEDRIVLLHSSLRGPVKEILNTDHGIVNPVRIHLCESSGRLVVGLVDGNVLVYQIMKIEDVPNTTVSN